jgi:hypothetical protein
METVVYSRVARSGKILLSETPKRNSVRHYARWKPVTAGRWRKIVEREFEPTFVPNTERRVWEHLLEDSSLLEGLKGGEKHDAEGRLTGQALKLILDFVPAHIPHRLLSALKLSGTISAYEMNVIKFQCHQLWVGKGSRLDNPHPLIEEAVTAMIFKERYGMAVYANVEEMPQKLYTAYRLVSSLYGEIQEINLQTRDLGEKAKRMAGLMGGPHDYGPSQSE